MLPSTIFRSEEINFTLAFIFFPSNRYRNADSLLWISERTYSFSVFSEVTPVFKHLL